MLISKEIISDINHRVDIVDIISDYVVLKPSGANYKGLCPFHKEKTPSFTVNRNEGFFHCFGCKESGNSISFLQKYLNITYVEAVRLLCLRYGIKIENDYDNKNETAESLMYKLYDSAKDFYISELYRIGEKALEYYKQRGLSNNTILKFGLGYSPNSYNSLVKHFSKSSYSSDILIKSGLLRKINNNIYDFFRNRAMFPIRDFMGRTIAFGGRQLEKDEKSGKYINSAESLIYDKKQTLYGLYESKTEIRKEKTAFIVEGYLDVISLEQAGICNVVAPCGTALSLNQLRLLKKHTSCEVLYLMFDGDEAGKTATFKGIKIALQIGFDLRIIDLPDGEDPDTLINKGGIEMFKKLKDESKNFVEYTFYALNRKNKLQSPAEKAAAIRDLIKSILLIPDKLQHKYYVDFIVDLFRVDVEELRKLYVKTRNELKETDLRKPFELGNKGDLKDLVKLENILDDFVKVINNESEENSNTEYIEAEELHPAEKAIFSYLLEHNDNFKFMQKKYNFEINFLVSSLGKDIYFWFKENEESEKIFQDLLENDEVPTKIKEVLSGLKMQKKYESKHWQNYSNIRIENKTAELIEIPLLQLKKEQIYQELSELREKIRLNTADDRILRRYQELIKEQKKYMDLLTTL
jgi:DNA primase